MPGELLASRSSLTRASEGTGLNSASIRLAAERLVYAPTSKPSSPLPLAKCLKHWVDELVTQWDAQPPSCRSMQPSLQVSIGGFNL